MTEASSSDCKLVVVCVAWRPCHEGSAALDRPCAEQLFVWRRSPYRRARRADLPKGKHVMSSVAPAASTAIPAAGRSVQNYIDETPVWSDGTTVRSTLMTAMQWWIWTLAAAFVGTSLLVTWAFRIDTTGVNLEKIWT